MRKLFCLFAVLIACLMLATVASAEATVPTTCQACNQEVTDWQVAPSSFAGLEGGHYHFYLNNNVSYYWLTPGKTADPVTVCLDLNGFHNTKEGRVLGVYNGHTVNIMDSSADQTGYMEGKKGTNNPTGGAIFNLGALNLYSGTLKFNTSGATDHKTYRGGVIAQYDYSTAEFNMYGGRVEGGQLVASSSGISQGAAIYASSGTINLYGGEVISGKTANNKLGDCIYLNKDETIATLTLSGNAKVDQIATNSSQAYVNIDGTYSGKARVRIASGITVTNGKQMGTATNSPKITGDLLCFDSTGTYWIPKVNDSKVEFTTYTSSGEWHYCEHCKDIRRWTALTSSNYTKPNSVAAEYHYYLDTTKTISQLQLMKGTSLCLDLYGNTHKSGGRALLANSGSVLNLMDTKGNGVLHSTGGSNNSRGLAITVSGSSVFNMYSGTVRYTAATHSNITNRYGMVAIGGTCNMYGGTFEGPDLKTLYSGSYAGTIQMYNSASALNIYGGTITAGKVGKHAPCVEVKESGQTVKLSGNANVDNIYFAYTGKKLTVSGDYTGTASVTFKTKPALGAEVGVAADNARILGTLTCTNDDWIIKVDGTKLVTAIDAPVVIVNGDTETGIATLQEAIDTCENGYIKLLQSMDEDVTIAENITIDLNGRNLTGTITVTGDATLYGMDSQTDDYDVSDNIYGQLTVTGNLAGEPNYLPITKDGKTSFHKYTVKITDMTLRPEKAGIYYKSSFLGDEVIAAAVESFGVALSVRENPNEANMNTLCTYSKFTNFEPGAKGNATTSTLLKGILKTTNAALSNKRNLNMQIYGRPYLKTADGYIFGTPANRSLAEQLQGVDEILPQQDEKTRKAVVELYKTYRTFLEGLNLTNTIQEKERLDKTLSILMVGNSFCYYYVEELYGLLMANPDSNRGYENVEIVNVYYSGCNLVQHHTWWVNGESKYDVYRTNEEGRKKLTPPAGEKWNLEDSLKLGDWDYISLQGASGEVKYASYTAEQNVEIIAPYATPLLARFHELFPDAQLLWHRTWPFEEGRVSGSTIYDADLNARYNVGMQATCDYMCEVFDQDKPYDLKIVNSGAAWVNAREANAQLETSLIPQGGLCARIGIYNNKNYPYHPENHNIGDGYHDGDIGGGQFVNACVWYETLTGQSVLENTYKPTKANGHYELSDAFVELLRTAAHAATK